MVVDSTITSIYTVHKLYNYNIFILSIYLTIWFALPTRIIGIWGPVLRLWWPFTKKTH